jgi:hypothetical protein
MRSLRTELEVLAYARHIRAKRAARARTRAGLVRGAMAALPALLRANALRRANAQQRVNSDASGDQSFTQ